ncbi:hypothetical protein DERP_005272 [Dermatophagoides pteronyssinus]|uniref:Uncharacterized protein n=1 Tax=Dermatophagoides pteronyssinus TaxID=6956 RepID=A0ABQ8JM39_DERPT|nr:hypothetical protein DERP_005272 [Dermatophagoides pteronyssinus]
MVNCSSLARISTLIRNLPILPVLARPNTSVPGEAGGGGGGGGIGKIFILVPFVDDDVCLMFRSLLINDLTLDDDDDAFGKSVVDCACIGNIGDNEDNGYANDDILVLRGINNGSCPFNEGVDVSFKHDDDESDSNDDDVVVVVEESGRITCGDLRLAAKPNSCIDIERCLSNLSEDDDCLSPLRV